MPQGSGFNTRRGSKLPVVKTTPPQWNYFLPQVIFSWHAFLYPLSLLNL